MYPSCFTLPYTFWRMKKIFKQDYHLEIVPVVEYKGSRYHDKLYDLVHEDGTIEMANVTLNGLRRGLTVEGYPLKEEDE